MSESDPDTLGIYVLLIIIFSFLYCVSCCEQSNKRNKEVAAAAVAGLAFSQIDNVMKDMELQEMRRRVAIEEQRRREMEYMAYCMACEEEQRRRQLMYYQQQQMQQYCNRRNPW